MKQINLSQTNQRKRTPGVKWGRPVTTGTGARQARNGFSPRFPLHVTLRLRKDLPNLRTRKGAQIVKHAMKGARERGVRIVHFAILSNHIHMIIEGKSQQTLSRAMKSFCSRLGLGIRKWGDKAIIQKLDKNGLGLFCGRYNVQVLTNATKVKNALLYVLQNPAKHFKKGYYIDKFTSAASFRGWKRLLGKELILPQHLKPLRQRLEEFLSPPGLRLLQRDWQYVRQ